MERLCIILEKMLLALILGLIFTPLLVTLPQWPTEARRLIHGKSTLTLAKTQAPSFFKQPSKDQLAARFFQSVEAFKTNLADTVNTQFFGRDQLIRWTNELWYQCLHTCAAKSTNIVIGREDALFEKLYLEEYCLTRFEAPALEPFVADLKRLQDLCEKLGVSFVLLVTPSKPALEPELVPTQWLQRYDPRPRGYDLLIPLLTQRGIHFVDGHALALREKPRMQTPVFPKGGTHWGQYAASLATNALLDQLIAQGQPLAPLEYNLNVGRKPGAEEADLLKLMRLVKRWRYPVSKLAIKPNPPGQGKRPALAFIGGSFMWRIAKQLKDSEQFAEIDSYFYYKLFKSCNSDIEKDFGKVREPTGEVDFSREIYAADCLVLELNEALINNPNHLKVFLADALSHAPLDGKRGPFAYESPQPPSRSGQSPALNVPGTLQPSSLSRFPLLPQGSYPWANRPLATLGANLVLRLQGAQSANPQALNGTEDSGLPKPNFASLLIHEKQP